RTAVNVGPNTSSAPSQPMATVNSTIGYSGEIDSLHPRQRPRSRSQPTIGTFSCHAIGASQRGQRDGGDTTESSCGQRDTHTFRKEPTQAPVSSASEVNNQGAAASSVTVSVRR